MWSAELVKPCPLRGGLPCRARNDPERGRRAPLQRLFHSEPCELAVPHVERDRVVLVIPAHVQAVLLEPGRWQWLADQERNEHDLEVGLHTRNRSGKTCAHDRALVPVPGYLVSLDADIDVRRPQKTDQQTA